MKYLKMLGLAAVAAMALTAFLGAGTASATTLCTENASPCPEAKQYKAGTTLHATLVPTSSARLTSPPGTTIVTCTESTVEGKTTNTTGTWILGDIETLHWGGCGGVTVDTIKNGSLEIMWTEGNKGEVVGKGSEVTVNIGVTCTYGTGEGTKLGTITGGSAPILKIEAKVKKTAGGFLCPSEPVWDAEYVLTEPHALFPIN